MTDGKFPPRTRALYPPPPRYDRHYYGPDRKNASTGKLVAGFTSAYRSSENLVPVCLLFSRHGTVASRGPQTGRHSGYSFGLWTVTLWRQEWTARCGLDPAPDVTLECRARDEIKKQQRIWAVPPAKLSNETKTSVTRNAAQLACRNRSRVPSAHRTYIGASQKHRKHPSQRDVPLYWSYNFAHTGFSRGARDCCTRTRTPGPIRMLPLQISISSVLLMSCRSLGVVVGPSQLIPRTPTCNVEPLRFRWTIMIALLERHALR